MKLPKLKGTQDILTRWQYVEGFAREIFKAITTQKCVRLFLEHEVISRSVGDKLIS